MSNAFLDAAKPYEPEKPVEEKSNGNGMGKNTQAGRKVNPINPIDSTWDDPVIPSRLVAPNIPADLLPGWLGGMWMRFPCTRKPHPEWL